jgi:glycosyltransferase involved in cell wall biosynthesis
LARTLASCLAQRDVDGTFEILVVDNDAAGSARPVVAVIAERSPVPLRYVREDRPGISYARNTGVTMAQGRYLAFIDDDEEAVPGWLAAFLTMIRRSGADLVVGPVYPRFPANLEQPARYKQQMFTYDAGVASGSLLQKWGSINNALLDHRRCFDGSSPFDPKLGLSGGEDAMFLAKLVRRGRTVAWCAEAAVWETHAAGRFETRYLLLRAFRGGQTTTYVHAAMRPREFGAVARWMAVGCAQVAVYGPAGVALRLFHHPRWLPVLVKAASGLGKVLWCSCLHPRLYRSGFTSRIETS